MTINKLTSLALGAGSIISYLKTPRSASELDRNFYHGTTTSRMRDVEVGQILEVKNHFFFTNLFKNAENYAIGSGRSAFRPGQSDEGSPLVLRVSLLNPSQSTWKIGFFGFNKYFVDGTQLKVEEVHYPKAPSPETKKAIEDSRWL